MTLAFQAKILREMPLIIQRPAIPQYNNQLIFLPITVKKTGQNSILSLVLLLVKTFIKEFGHRNP